LCRYYKNENLIEIIRLLIGKEIGINSKNNYGSNALHELCTNYENDNLIDIIQLLIENGIEVTSETFNYFTKNYYKEDHNEILQLLGSKEDETRPAKRMKFN
jgi:ankyrin repeat protein